MLIALVYDKSADQCDLSIYNYKHSVHGCSPVKSFIRLTRKLY